ncbi:MAG: hypothetical protein IPP49_05460 [Saprospiraceae bacterium]|nr:hypothetical protein [Saprospiraceae bacterium]
MKWTVIDKQGYKNSCIQVITLVDKKPFKSNEIVWPENYETNKCFSNLDPAFLPAKIVFLLTVMTIAVW